MNRNTTKYNKVTQQQKFHLLTLVLKDKLLIKEVLLLLVRLLNLLTSTTPLLKPSSFFTEITPKAISLILHRKGHMLLFREPKLLFRNCHLISPIPTKVQKAVLWQLMLLALLEFVLMIWGTHMRKMNPTLSSTGHYIRRNPLGTIRSLTTICMPNKKEWLKMS